MEGAAQKFYGHNDALDVWPTKKVNLQSMIQLTSSCSRAMERKKVAASFLPA